MFQDLPERLRLIQDEGLDTLLRDGRIGIEKESLRVSPDGRIARTPHPRGLGSALTNPYITTDYSEALLEFITPPFDDVRETLAFLDHVHRFVYEHVGDELLWATSMPCMVEADDAIPIAEYGRSNVGFMKHVYRRGLSWRYGRLMQIISGVHFNWSLPERFWVGYQKLREDRSPRRDAVAHGYFGLIRNFQRLGWIVPYLFGASPAVCRSFLRGREQGFDTLEPGTRYLPWATSLRMSDIGYKNKSQERLQVRYDDLDAYVASLGRAIHTPHPEYQAIGVRADGEWRQLNPNLLQIENEYYSFVRPKQVARSGEKPILALKRRGMRYVEIRALDVSAWDPLGVNEPELRFLEAFLILCGLLDSPPIDDAERAELEHNQREVAARGRESRLELRIGGEHRGLREVAAELIEALEPVCALLDADEPEPCYEPARRRQRETVEDPTRLPSARILTELRERDESFFSFAMRLSHAHREHFRHPPLGSTHRTMLEEEARRSLEQQRAIEEADGMSFEEYLRRYFAQARDERERILG